MEDTVGIHHCYSRHAIDLVIEFTFQPSSIVTPRVLHNVYLSECPNESSAMSGSDSIPYLRSSGMSDKFTERCTREGHGRGRRDRHTSTGRKRSHMCRSVRTFNVCSRDPCGS